MSAARQVCGGWVAAVRAAAAAADLISALEISMTINLPGFQ
jgi:hypothetical protein